MSDENENNDEQTNDEPKKNEWIKFLASVVSSLAFTLVWAYLGSSFVFLQRYVARNKTHEGECFGTLFPSDLSKPPYCGGGSESSKQKGGGLKNKMTNMLNDLTFGINECSWPYNETGWFMASISETMKTVYPKGRGILNGLMNFTNSFSEKGTGNLYVILFVAPIIIGILLSVAPVFSFLMTMIFGIVCGVPLSGLKSVKNDSWSGFLGFFQHYGGKLLWGLIWFFGLWILLTVATTLVQWVQLFFTYTLLPLALNYASLFSIMARNYLLYVCMFGIMIVASAFEFLNYYASVPMLLTLSYFVGKEMYNAFLGIGKKGEKPCY